MPGLPLLLLLLLQMTVVQHGMVVQGGGVLLGEPARMAWLDFGAWEGG